MLVQSGGYNACPGVFPDSTKTKKPRNLNIYRLRLQLDSSGGMHFLESNRAECFSRSTGHMGVSFFEAALFAPVKGDNRSTHFQGPNHVETNGPRDVGFPSGFPFAKRGCQKTPLPARLLQFGRCHAGGLELADRLPRLEGSVSNLPRPKNAQNMPRI